jgi:hypothetical protein
VSDGTPRWLACIILGGCTIYTGHTIAPYGNVPAEAHKLEDRAAARCLHWSGDLPPYSFATDGCSYWPDGSWKDCCVRDDMAYWCGGTFSDRLEADSAREQCVDERADSWLLSRTMRFGVFVGGGQLLPTSFRWGYGWPYPGSGP